MKEVEDDTDEARTNDSDEDMDDEDEEESEESNDDDGSDDESIEDMDDDSEDDNDNDGIDIGSHIGLTLEDEEIFGVIIEFDDDEETVTIKEDGTEDLVTGYQEDMFVE
tara:strand:- start:99 stop:425 length:327 start_codon:yes stop_codon:yes gene_type:complete